MCVLGGGGGIAWDPAGTLAPQEFKSQDYALLLRMRLLSLTLSTTKSLSPHSPESCLVAADQLSKSDHIAAGWLYS